MSEYWLMDANGGVLGPVGLPVLKDLAGAGLVSAQTRVARDGRTFGPLSQFPEVEALLAPSSVTAARAREQEQAQTVRLELDRYRSLPAHQIFNVAPNAGWNEFRQGFLELAKRYHPARLPKGAHPDLLHARMEIFQFLNGELSKVEKRLQSESGGSRVTPADATTMGRPLPPGRESILELSRLDEQRMRAVIQVPQGSTALFTAHRVVNLSAGGMFLATSTAIRLGTRLELLMRFMLQPLKEIQTRGVVVLESAIATEKQPAGVGVKLERLSEEDKSFLKSFVASAEQAERRA